MKKYLPEPAVLVNLEPEEVGIYLLQYLVKLEESGTHLNSYNLLLESSPDFALYTNGFFQTPLVVKILSETFQWLKNAGLVAESATNSNGWIFITRRGKTIRTKADFQKLTYLKLLPIYEIDQVLKDKIISSYMRGDFSTCVFISFREVEIRLREGAKLDNTWYGVKLADMAFDPKKGLLTDPELTDIEKTRYHEMLRGTIGTFKNPLSHRDVNYDDPVIAIGLILFANSLIKTIETRALAYTLIRQVDEQAIRP